MKRGLDAFGAAAGNDSRAKVKDRLLPFDQSREEAGRSLAVACAFVLDGRPDKCISLRGLMHEVNGAVAPGAFTKRGEARSAASYVKQVYGGCRQWIETLPGDAFRVVGDWESSHVSLRLAGGAASPAEEGASGGREAVPLVDGARRAGRCSFWDSRHGWGKVAVDDAGGAKVFVHWRDLAAGRTSLPRGARVDLRLAASDRGFGGVDVRVLRTTSADVDALLTSGCLASAMMIIDDAAPAVPPAAPAPADDDDMMAMTPDSSFVLAPATYDHHPPPPPPVIDDDDDELLLAPPVVVPGDDDGGGVSAAPDPPVRPVTP